MGRINKTNKANPVSADEFLIYDSQDTSDDKNITLGQVATFVESQDSTIAGTKVFADGVQFEKGNISFGQYSPLPTGLGSYVASYVSSTYGPRLLGYNGSAYRDLSIGSMPTTGIVSIKSLANGDVNIGYNLNITEDCTATKFYGDGSELTGIVSGVSIFDNKDTVTTNITLTENVITTGYWSGTNTITLPTVTDTTKQVVCILDFTTATSSQPSINQYKNLTGTFSVTNGDATVTGTGSSLTTEIKANDKILIASVEYTVLSVTSNTALELTANYAGTNASGLTLSRKYIRWSDKNGGKPPTSYSTLIGIRNKIEFKSIFEGGLLYWEAEYSSYGGVETTFVQPPLSANGTLGGSNFAVYANSEYYPAYYGADNSSTTDWLSNTGTGEYTWYNPNALKVSSVSIYNPYTSASYYITGYTLYGSNDNSNWTTLKSGTNSTASANSLWTITIDEANRSFYKYYKLYAYSNGGNVGFSRAILNGVYIAT